MPNFDPKTLETLLHDFYNLTHIKACLYDAEENELCFYPTRLSAFCELLRKDEHTDRQCRACDRLAFASCKKTRSQYVYTCHAGLQECVSPIVCDNRIVGFIMIGQIKSDRNGDKAPSELLPTRLSETRRKELLVAYESLPSISNQTLLSAFRILDACAGYELLKTHLRQRQTSIDAQINQFVHERLASPLTVATLCSELRLSRHEIYGICNRYFHCGPAEYIKKCRLTYACSLLRTTKLPVNQIAIRCGISDYNYFSKVFKASYGISPTEYRKTNSDPKSE